MTRPTVSHDTIGEALDVLAEIIARDGAAYLPLFERLEREYNLIQSKNDTLSRALARAGNRQGGNVSSMTKAA